MRRLAPSKWRRFMVSSLPVFSSFAQRATPCEARATETGAGSRQAWRGTVKGWRSATPAWRRSPRSISSRRVAGLRQSTGRVHHRRRQGRALRAAAGDGGQPHAVDELRRRPCDGASAISHAPRNSPGTPTRASGRGSRRPRPGSPAKPTAAWRSTRTWPTEWPRDLLAGKLGQLHAFNRGDAEALLRIGERLFAANRDNRYVYAMYAFGLEECNRIDEAEATRAPGARHGPPRSLGAPRRRPLPGGARQDAEGVAFLESMSDTWEGCNSFMYTHNWWHLALFLIDLDRTDEALALFDKRVWGVWKEFSEDQINAVSLLARLELRGVDVGDALGRRRELSQAAPARALLALPRPALSLRPGPRRRAERRHRNAGEPRGPRRERQALRARGLGRLRRAGRARARRLRQGRRCRGRAPAGPGDAAPAADRRQHRPARAVRRHPSRRADEIGLERRRARHPAGRRSRAADRAVDQALARRPLSPRRPHRAGAGRRVPGRAARAAISRQDGKRGRPT